jgi:osmotically inducible lipoprotein OsmB
MRRLLITAAAIALALSAGACTTMESRLGGAAAGAGAGAVIGGPIGAAAGGVVGALAGPRVVRATR